MSEADGLWYTDGDIGMSWDCSPPPTQARHVLLFGGTFDPPHIGHLTMANLAIEQTDVDEVWFLPAPSPPHKLEITDDTFDWRVRMVDALVQAYPSLRAMSLERHLPRPSFSVDTVQACQTWYPDVHFSFLLGTDNLAKLHTWHDALALTRRIHFFVAARTGYPLDDTLANVRLRLPDLTVHRIDMPLLDISSTWLRTRLQQGLDPCGLIPQNVLNVWRQGACRAPSQHE